MAKIRWKNYLSEILVVIIGILIAFQLNQCSENNKQQKLIDAHINYIKEETKINEINLGYAIKYSKVTLKNLDSIIDLVLKKGASKKINELSFKALDVGYLYVRKNAYNSLINSGDIRYISSFEKKKTIINMYEYYSWTQSLDEACRIAYLDDFLPYLKEHFDLVTAKVQEDDVYYSKQFLNSVSTYRYALDAKIKKFEDCSKEIKSFKNNIESF